MHSFNFLNLYFISTLFLCAMAIYGCRTQNDLYTVRFTSPDTGFIAGYATFKETFDGGNTWSQNPSINEDSFTFYDIDFPSRKVAYVVGGGYDGVAVFKTIDGGITWNDVSPNWSILFHCVHFLNKDTGFQSETANHIISKVLVE